MAAAQPTGPGRENHASYLPDFCHPRMVLAVVLIVELLAIVLVLAGGGTGEAFWLELARNSLYLLWIGLTSAWLLCLARPRLAGLDTARLTAASLGLLLGTTLVIAEAAWWLGALTVSAGGPGFFPADHAGFLARSLGISAIVNALALRYFYVSHHWRRNVEMESRSRVNALQARIRPHFLFNSMNTIAALTRSDPEKAEQAVEDLADLFRASLADAKHQIPMKEEFEMARIYQRIEQLRLGERLRVEWLVQELPMRALIPALTVQPLLENAIYHGIEPLPDGGTVTIAGERRGDMIQISVSNPVLPDPVSPRKDGNRMALANISERLSLAYGNRSRLEVRADAERYSVTLVFPCSTPTAHG